MSFLYFAYGSNMLSSRLTPRCPSAKLIGIASARQHALKFSKKSIYGSGKATLLECVDAIYTPGVLFEIEEGEREELDKFEGAGKGYDRKVRQGRGLIDSAQAANVSHFSLFQHRKRRPQYRHPSFRQQMGNRATPAGLRAALHRLAAGLVHG